MPGYAPTPLVEAAGLAQELEVGRLFVKDESQRLGLPAFKILGASYAIARTLSRRLGLSEPVPTLDELRTHLDGAPDLCLAAATDGNHGRAVAHVAGLLGLRSTIYVPLEVSDAAKEAITAEGASLVVLDVPYDDVVRHAAAVSGDDVILIQDTSWAGYEDVPQWIVDGYDTMLAEMDQQVDDAAAGHLDLVVVPAGVGSLAQAVVRHYRSNGTHPAVLVVEPDTAASVTTSLRAGRIVSVPTGDTIMTGLNCGTVSELAFPALRAGLDASITVSDRAAFDAVGSLASCGIDSGPCGAATLAGVRAIFADPGRRSALGISRDAVVALLSTEGVSANPKQPS